MAAAGVSIDSLVDYSRREPDWLQRLLAVYNKLGQDVPGTPAQGEVIVGMAGVLPQYRRRGIATALKIQGVRYAPAAGFKVMVTSTSSVNVANIAVNERLGFRQTRAEIRLEKPICSLTT